MLRKETFVRRVLATFTVLALALLGCGGGPALTPQVTASGGIPLGENDTIFCGVFNTGTVIDIKDLKFNPPDVTIAVNGEVDWKNSDNTTHVIKFDSGTTCGTVMAGQTKKVRFSAAGLYPYHCTIHPDMKGTITVQ
ncbi:MAG: cupredoxin domain-containing protein [Candidatus Limnocylindrales bacterium]